MSYPLSAEAAEFHPTSRNNTVDLVAEIPIRSIQEIGDYANGVLRPRPGVTSQLVWREAVSIPEKCSKEAQKESMEHREQQSSPKHAIPGHGDTATQATPSENMTETSEFNPSDIEWYKSLPPWRDEDVEEEACYEPSIQPGIMSNPFTMPPFLMYPTPMPYYGQQFPYPIMQHVYRQSEMYQSILPHPQYHGFLPSPPVTPPNQSDIPQDGERKWIPQYHKQRSPYLQRANHAVEEFKIYFGDGNGNILDSLRKICYLCHLADPAKPPATEKDCTALLRNIYINVFDLIAAGRADQAGLHPPPIPTFRSSKQFFDYCTEQDKICPRWIGRANKLFEAVMDRFRRAD